MAVTNQDRTGPALGGESNELSRPTTRENQAELQKAKDIAQEVRDREAAEQEQERDQEREREELEK